MGYDFVCNFVRELGERMAKVSVLIPVYNTAKYLQKCLDSVINQTLYDIEIVCINDGSTDESRFILEEYAKKDIRIKVHNKENGGLVAARKTGLELATGEYIGFVDSDDWIEPDMYEKLYNLASQYNADLITCGYYLEGNYTSVLLDTVSEGFYGAEQMPFLRENTIFNMDKKDVGIRASLCCKLFRTEKIREAECKIPNTVTISEDRLCNLAFMLECDSAYVLREPFYHYVIHPSSMVHKGDTNYLTCVNEVYKCYLELFQHPRFTDSMRLQAEIYIAEMLLKGINTRLGFQNRNMLWIDSYWLDSIPKNAKVILYGAGELGEIHKKHLSVRSDIEYVGCVDFGFERFANASGSALLGEIMSPDKLSVLEYDYVVITIKNEAKAEEVRNKLKTYTLEEKILWFQQEEIYWKYIEAAGLV